jgi:hypothetical protein
MLAEEFGIITDNEVGEAMESPEILADYPDDRPYPSCLLLGFTKATRPLHLVAAFDESDRKIVVVTVYQPDPDQWEDYRRRK